MHTYTLATIYHNVIRGMPPGPWSEEPDVVSWSMMFRQGTIKCMVERGNLGTLGGCVGMPKSHPFFGMDHDDIEDKMPTGVHHGLTASGELAERPGWWMIGFDCTHHTDVIPALATTHSSAYATYKGVDYVVSHVTHLAKHVAGMWRIIDVDLPAARVVKSKQW